MSATILNYKAFCRSVGLSHDDVKFKVKSDFSVTHRAIYSLILRILTMTAYLLI